MSNIVGDSSNPQVAAISGKHTSQGIGVDAESAEKWAIRANAPKDTAIFAISEVGRGIDARSKTHSGVEGFSEQGTGIYAKSIKGIGLHAESAEKWAIRAITPKDTAIYATSITGIGVHAESTKNTGVWAFSEQGIGVRATAEKDTAVYATTNTGFAAVHAAGGIYAGYFDGVVRVTGDIQIDNGEVALSGSNTTSGGLQMRLGVGRCGSYRWSGSAEQYVVETSSHGNPFPVARNLKNGDLVIGWNASQGQGETSFYSFRKDGWCGGFGFWCNQPAYGSDDYWLYRICEMRGAFSSTTGQSRGPAVYAQEYRTISDARLKADTHKLEGCLEKLGRINGKSFKWRHLGSNSARDFGLEAQDVRTVFPELVSDEDNSQENEPLSLNYNGFIPVIVEALKEVTTRLQAVENLHTQMQARLKELEQRLDN